MSDRKRYESWQYVQIMPCDGWYAAFADEDKPDGVFIEQIIAWALVRVPESDKLGYTIEHNITCEGLTAGPEGIDRVEEISNFIGYFRVDELDGAEPDRRSVRAVRREWKPRG